MTNIKDLTGIPGFLRQLSCGLILSSLLLSLGTNVTWSNIIPKINNDTSFEQLSFTDTQWIVSSIRVGATFMPLLAGALAEWLGACRLMRLCIPPTIAMSLIMAYVPSKFALYAGRLGQGVANGIIYTMVSLLLTELTSAEIRGVLASVSRIMGAVGVLLMYVMADYLPWRLATALGAAPLVPVFFFMFWVPESPYWLMRNHQEEEALRGLARLRGPRGNPRAELDRIKKAIAQRPSVTVADQFRLMKKPENYKPTLLMIATSSLSMLTGHAIIFQYTVFIFQKAGMDQIDEYDCTVLVGVVRLLSLIASLFVIDLVDRRPLLITSALVCALILVLTSVCLMVPSLPSWLVLVFVLAFVASLSLGVSVLPNLVASELIPTPVRSIGVGLCSKVTILVALMMSLTFPLMVVEIGLEYSFLIFAGFNLALAGMFWLWVPETRARSLNDLQEVFSAERKKESLEEENAFDACQRHAVAKEKVLDNDTEQESAEQGLNKSLIKVEQGQAKGKGYQQEQGKGKSYQDQAKDEVQQQQGKGEDYQGQSNSGRYQGQKINHEGQGKGITNLAFVLDPTEHDQVRIQ